MAFLDDSLTSYQLGILTVCPTCGSLTCEDQLWCPWETPWVGGNLGCLDAVIIESIATVEGQTGRSQIQMTLCFLR